MSPTPFSKKSPDLLALDIMAKPDDSGPTSRTPSDGDGDEPPEQPTDESQGASPEALLDSIRSTLDRLQGLLRTS